MSKFRVSWNDKGSEERSTRKFDTAEEARGFIKGLRLSKDHEMITLRIQNEAGQYAKAKIAAVFPANENPAPL